ncbi:phosphatidate cytidylyltransferase [Amnibacterium sp.]|uniref:phosphatidate cytidylyltransferase n=1 Tax=Amnibacterium sp. TaxID=1872496 RepID=UPI00261BCB7C|nr:phosphatidate cytidylyltransferase [Amnibacterium sp.]MCU1473657.1 phosphatidate cytidylyltransferase [Amnibacterium sp.]
MEDDEGGRTPRRRPRTTWELQEQIRATRSDIVGQVRATRLQFDQANARITARTGRNLVVAIGLGLVLGAALLVSLIVAKQLFLIVAVVLVGFGAFELAGALRHAGIRVPRAGSATAGVLAQPVAFFAMSPGPDGAPVLPAGWLLAVLGAVVLAVAWRIAEEAQAATPRRPLVRDLLTTAFVQLYVTGLGSCAAVLTAQAGGQWWTLSFVAVVVATDLFAYVSGLLFGKHPMAPRISPKKTWEGFAGSAIMAIVVASVLAPLLLGEPIWFGPIFGVVVLLCGTLGDLGESMIKRDIGVKDISGLLPGHGGFLDRIDSVLPSGAAALLLLFLAR